MKRLLTLALLLALSFPMLAEHVDLSKAQIVAETVLSEDQLVLLPQHFFENIYIFNSEHGFVVVAADNRVNPVLAYSDHSQFQVENMPENLQYWMQSLNDGIQNAIDQRLEPTEEIREEWMLLISGKQLAPKSRTMVPPLVKTHWDQFEPYNNLCPGDCPTGCVATAMAQIMKYWEWPITGTGTYSYTHSVYGELSADFGNTTYDWDNMIDMLTTSSTTAQQDALATLMYHCGVAVNMNYCSGSGSASSPYSYLSSLPIYFDYNQSDLQRLDASGYNTESWIALLKAELDCGRPMLYSGDKTGSPGHTFICDGYDTNNFLHFNWGWSGGSDGYYAYGNLYGYNASNSILKGIHPNEPPISAPTNFTATVLDYSITMNWTAVAGASHYKVYRDGFVVNTFVSDTSCTIPFLDYGQHDYYVKAVNSEGICSLRSNAVSIAIPFNGPVPSNLNANVQFNNVNLNWTAPVCGNGQLKYGDGQTTQGIFGGAGIGLYWGQRFTPVQLAPYAGMAITSVQIFLVYETQYTLLIFKEEDGELTQLASQEFNNNSSMQWYTVNLDIPVVVDYSSNLLVVFHNDTHQMPASKIENYTEGDGNARLYSMTNTSFVSVNQNISWLIKTNVTDGVYTYNVYRDGNSIASNLTQTNYTDNDLEEGTYCYTVKTNYYGGLSEPSNSATAVVEPLQDYSITVSSNPPAGGSVSGGGIYTGGTMVTLTASPNEGYSFVNWTLEGVEVSSDPFYTFVAAGEGDYVANFSLNSYDIIATANLPEGGTISGAGPYYHGDTATLTIDLNPNYFFENWTENGIVVSEDPSFSVVVTRDHAFEANLTYFDGVLETDGNSVVIYPNPTQDKIWIASPEVISTYKIYNAIGLLVGSAVVNTQRFEIDLENFLVGSYFIRLVSNNSITTYKIIVKR